MLEQYAQLIIRWRYFVVVSIIAVILAAASGAKNLAFTNDYRAFFGKENPQLQAFEKLQNTYSKNDNVIIVLAPKDGKVFTKKTLLILNEITKKAWQTPYSSRVDSISNFQYTYAEEDDLIVDGLIPDPALMTEAEIEKVKTIALNENLLINRLISPRAHVTGINVTIQLPGVDEKNEVPQVAAFVRKLAADTMQKYPDVKIYLTGIMMMNNAFPEASMKDVQTLIPMMFLVVILAFGFMLRTISGTVVAILVIFLSIIGAMGMAGWMRIDLTPPTLSAPIMILTLAVADCVHMLASFFHEYHRLNDKKLAMIESLRINFQPIFLTSITTSIGFMSMNFSDSPPFRDLGNIVAVGVIFAFCLSISFLPALMMILPVKNIKKPVDDNHLMMQLSRFVIKRRNQLLVGMLLLAIGLTLSISRNELNDDFVKYFKPPIDFRLDTDFTADNLTGMFLIEYSLDSGKSGGVSEPAFLSKVEAFSQWYRQQPEVMNVNTLTDVMKRLNKNLHGDDASWYKIPENRKLAAQYLLLYEMSLPYGLDLTNQINVDKSATKVSVTAKNLTSQELLGLEQRAQSWLKHHAPEMVTEGTGTSIMFAHISFRNIISMLQGTTVALVLISLILVIALRSLKIGLISLIPNLVPAAMAFGLWGLFVGEVGLALSVVTGMTLGIVVDDTVHFLSKYLRARREQQLSAQAAVEYAFSSVGMALWTTSVVLIIGFCVLTFSSFKLNADMGLLTAVTIGLALIADFLLLPPLLMKIEGNND